MVPDAGRCLAFVGTDDQLLDMRAITKRSIVAISLMAAAVLGCNRTSQDDVSRLGKATQKTAKDLTNEVGADSEDAWLTTKVKSALSADGFDPLHVHVDTSGKIVTLSGSVDGAGKKEKAVNVAKGVTGVLEVEDHLTVKAEPRRP